MITIISILIEGLDALVEIWLSLALRAFSRFKRSSTVVVRVILSLPVYEGDGCRQKSGMIAAVYLIHHRALPRKKNCYKRPLLHHGPTLTQRSSHFFVKAAKMATNCQSTKPCRSHDGPTLQSFPWKTRAGRALGATGSTAGGESLSSSRGLSPQSLFDSRWELGLNLHILRGYCVLNRNGNREIESDRFRSKTLKNILLQELGD